MFLQREKGQVTRVQGNPALAAWPVGAVFLGYGSTSPATLLGGGTWVQIAQGKMLVGQNSADTDFDVVGDTGGEKTHFMTENEVGDHQHYSGTLATGTNGDHAHSLDFSAGTGSVTGNIPKGTSTFSNQNSAPVHTNGDHSHGVNGQVGMRVGGTGQAAMPIMNPYLVVYMWRRTA